MSLTSDFLSSLRGHAETMQQMLGCKVCLKPLYEPYTLSCGHTFCYSCLKQWFSQNDRAKSCPNCRSKITAAPSPSWLLREIVHLYTTNEDLLQDGDSLEDHDLARKADAAEIERDKLSDDPDHGGLFQGCFSRPVVRPRIRDLDDGVDRCPHCFFELEDGDCGRCGYHDEDFDEEDLYGEEDDFDDDQSNVSHGLDGAVDALWGPGLQYEDHLTARFFGSEDDEEEGLEEMRSFIDDDEGETYGFESDASNSEDDRSDSDALVERTAGNLSSDLDEASAVETVYDDDSNDGDGGDDSSEDEDAIPIRDAGSRQLAVRSNGEGARSANRRVHVVLSSSDSDSDAESKTEAGSPSGTAQASSLNSEHETVVSDSASSSDSDSGSEPEELPSSDPPAARHRSGHTQTTKAGRTPATAISLDDEEDEDDDDDEPVRAPRKRRRIS